MSEKYFIVTYGCQMNVHESEKIAKIFEDMGFVLADDRNTADYLVFNTCAIREGATERAFGNIGALKKRKRENKNLCIIVCGCMTQKENEAKRLYEKFPFVDIIIGTHNIDFIKDYIEKRRNLKKRQLELFEDGQIHEGTGYKRSDLANAYVNIIYGCNNFCTYCIVPYVRGREKSRQKLDILNEIEELIKQGYKKITLLGQNVNSYGKDLEPKESFSNLMNDICKLKGDFKLTFMTSHPKDLTDDVIDVIANNEKILNEIHLPMQSGSNRILKLMNRKYTREKYLEIVEKIRKKIPDVRLTSDFIVGFPTETEDDFNDTLDIIKRVKFDGIFGYMYSVREGTVAAKMDGQIDFKTKNYRVNKLLELEKEIKKEKQ